MKKWITFTAILCFVSFTLMAQKPPQPPPPPPPPPTAEEAPKPPAAEMPPGFDVEYTLGQLVSRLATKGVKPEFFEGEFDLKRFGITAAEREDPKKLSLSLGAFVHAVKKTAWKPNVDVDELRDEVENLESKEDIGEFLKKLQRSIYSRNFQEGWDFGMFELKCMHASY